MKKWIAAFLVCSSGSTLAQQAAPAPAPPPSARPGDAVLIQRCEGNFSMAQTYALARHWIDAWNSNSADTVMALYTPDFEFRGPGIITSPRRSDPSGVLHGQADNRLRWFDPAAKGVKGSNNFRLIDAFAGVRSITVHYNGANGRAVTEIMEYTPDCRIERSNALYGDYLPGTAPAAPTSAAK